MGKGGSVSDEEWAQFLREAEAGPEAAPREPSARARMVARRWRDEPDRPEGWRTHRPDQRRRGKGRYAAGLVVVVALLGAVVAVAPQRVAGWFGSGQEAPLAAESERPKQPPADVAAQEPTLKEPFRGAPAARWGDGTAGIHVPAARATGWMSKAQVTQVLQKSRDFLAASSLDPGVLRGGFPGRAIALINPDQPDVQRYLAAAFSKPGEENDPLLLFSRFEKDEVRLVGDVVKTRGRMTFREGERGAVEVSTDVTYVYPVARTDGGRDEVARTIVRREIVMSWDDPAKVRIKPGTFSMVSYKLDVTNGGCDAYTGGHFTPVFDTEHESPGPGPAVDPYDRSTTMDERMRESGNADCGAATRT
ncbi:hypothetical protein AB0B50_38840 [Streptomyces sp. NPDC041068]|uniref:hypothetical protein n=1 Tax=Streptomyces sp. NPDC041068 TaxID=3155130 RepID=UPI003410B5C1